MSGGSYDYAYLRARDGDELGKPYRYVDEYTAQLRGILEGPPTQIPVQRAGAPAGYSDPVRRTRTPREQAMIDAGGAALLRNLQRFKLAYEAAQAAALECADIMYALEWCASHDTGPDDVEETCAIYLYEKLGMKAASCRWCSEVIPEADAVHACAHLPGPVTP